MIFPLIVCFFVALCLLLCGLLNAYNVFCVLSVDLLTFFQKRSLQIHIIGRIIKSQTTRNNIKRLKSQQQTTYKHGGNII